MSTTIRHCRNCACQRPHLHLHDCAHGFPETHMHGTERFVCQTCDLPTFAYSDGAERFPFVLDGQGRPAVTSHVGALP